MRKTGMILLSANEGKLQQHHNLDPDVIEKMYRIMMDYFIKEQLELLKERQK